CLSFFQSDNTLFPFNKFSRGQMKYSKLLGISTRVPNRSFIETSSLQILSLLRREKSFCSISDWPNATLVKCNRHRRVLEVPAFMDSRRLMRRWNKSI